MSADETLRKLGEFADEHNGTIANALGNHARRMIEAAELADSQGQASYARMFREDAKNAEHVLYRLGDLLEELADQRQEDPANQG